MTPRALFTAIRKLVAPLERRVRLMVSRAVVTLVDDARRLQSLQVTLLADEVRDSVERFQQYGFSSHPKPGAEAVYLAVGGNRDHGVIVAVDDRRHRPTGIPPGEVWLYTHEGPLLALKTGQLVELGPNPTDPVALAPPADSRFGAIEAKLNDLITKFNTHVQPTGTGPSGPPTVQETPLSAGQSVAAAKVKAI